MSINMLEFFCESEAPHPGLSAGGHPVRTGQARRGFTDSRDFPVSAKMRLPENPALAGRPTGFLKSKGRFGGIKG